VDKNGNKNWLISIAKAGKKSSNNFGRKHTSLYLCTPILKNGMAVNAKDL
jgi:hypothetical protein